MVNSHTRYRMWYLTDQSTPAGLSLCPGCGLLATGPSSYRNGLGRGGSARVREGRALHQYCFYHITSTTEQLQCASAHKDAAIMCAAFSLDSLCIAMEPGKPRRDRRSMGTNHEPIHLYLQRWRQNQYARIGVATVWRLFNSFLWQRRIKNVWWHPKQGKRIQTSPQPKPQT